MVRAWRSARALPVGDLIVAGVPFWLTLALLGHRGGASRGLDALGVALAAIACFPLIARRHAPLVVLAVTTAASATLNALGYPEGPPFGPTVALFFVAIDRRTPARLRQTGVIVVGLYATHIGATAVGHQGFPTVAILSGIVVWGGAWIVGDQLRQRRQRLADLAERARRADHEMERERRLAAAEERTRIARDLHDSAAHAINVILVQAGAARLLQRGDPEAVTSALTTIEDVARETIGEIDQLIRGLRADGDSEDDEQAVEPPIGLSALDALAQRHRAAGNRVEIRVRGTRRTLAPGLNQAAYRILQESLTNAARHGSGPAEVEVTYGKDRLELTVSNLLESDANGAAPEGGHGILGMRERAALLGGALEAGGEDGHFRVHACLPYQPAKEK
jgi:signal transduction histidine kinase